MKNSGIAIASMVLGIVGIIFAFAIPFVGLICAILALVLGIVGRSQITNSNGQIAGGGMAVAGIVLGAVVLLLSIIMMAACAAFLGTLSSTLQ